MSVDSPKSVVEQELAPVIYELGKALYIAQLFEKNLYLLVALFSGQENRVDSDTFLAGIERHKKLTLGPLATAFTKKAKLPTNIEEQLQEGVDARNNIIHGFVLRNSKKFQSKAGREDLIDELQATQRILHDRLEFTEAVFASIDRVIGGSLARQQAEAMFNFEADLASTATPQIKH